MNGRTVRRALRWSEASRWFPTILIGTALLAVLLQREIACWDGPVDFRFAALQGIWIVVVYGALYLFAASIQATPGQSLSIIRVLVSAVVAAAVVATGARVWAASRTSVSLTCSLIQVRDTPRDPESWLTLAGVYERLANEDYPDEWTASSTTAARRIDALLSWGSEMRGKAMDAYLEAAEIAPNDWRPLHGVASGLFTEGDCDQGARFAAQATRLVATQTDSRGRSRGEQQVRLLELSEQLCRRLKKAPR